MSTQPTGFSRDASSLPTSPRTSSMSADFPIAEISQLDEHDAAINAQTGAHAFTPTARAGRVRARVVHRAGPAEVGDLRRSEPTQECAAPSGDRRSLPRG